MRETESGKTWPDFGQCLADFDRIWAISVHFGPELAKVWRFRPFGTNLAQLCQIWAMPAGLRSVSPKFGPESSTSWRCRSNLDQLWRMFWPIWAISAELGPKPPKYGPDSSTFSRFRSKLDQPWPNVRQNSDPFRQHLALNLPNVGDSGRSWPYLGQISTRRSGSTTGS